MKSIEFFVGSDRYSVSYTISGRLFFRKNYHEIDRGEFSSVVRNHKIDTTEWKKTLGIK